MKHEINRYFDAITSERSDEDFLRGALESAEEDMKKHRSFKKAVVIPIAAAATIAVCGVGVGAAYGFEHLTELFKGNENITSEIQTNIFSDTDGHVSVTIEQLVSDGRHVHAAVHYEALDEAGREWLAGEPFGGKENGYNENAIKFGISDVADNEFDDNIYGDCFEFIDRRTDNSRYFYFFGEISDDMWGAENLAAVFSYPMSTGSKQTHDIDITGTLEMKRYTIVGDERCSEYLSPIYLDISPLSYTVFAHDDYGLVVKEYPPEGGYRMYISISDEEYYEEILMKKAYLVLSDGEKIRLPDECGGPRDDYYIWFCGEIFDTDGQWSHLERDYSVAFDYDELVGIEIDGVYYDLIAE